MAKWVDMEAEKSRTERMSPREYKKHERSVICIFLRLHVNHWAIRRLIFDSEDLDHFNFLRNFAGFWKVIWKMQFYRMSDLALDESTKVLESHGLYVDDLSRVRVVDQDTADSSSKWPSDFLTFFSLSRNRETLFSEKTKDSVDDFTADFKTFLSMINDFSSQADAMGKVFLRSKLSWFLNKYHSIFYFYFNDTNYLQSLF